MNKIHLYDAQSLAFVQGQAYRINSTVYEARYPEWDFARLAFVDTSGPAWSPGVLTYMSDISGQAKWQSSYAKDIPLADVSQDMQLKSHRLAAIGYHYTLEEVNTIMATPGMQLPDRRARAARMAYQKFMYDLVLFGDSTVNWGGITNYPGVTPTAAPNGTGSAPLSAWVLNTGAGNKTPTEILRDLNLALSGVAAQTLDILLADTILLPQAAYDYIAMTPFSPMTTETILSFFRRNNIYTERTGQAITVMPLRELATAATVGINGGGRMVAYRNDPAYIKTHLPMPHQFLAVYQDGPMNYTVPGIFRTGGLEVLTTALFRYIDGITQVPG